jgi:type I restriction enzyme S subunit
MSKYIFLKEAADIIMGQSPASSTYNDEGKGLPFYQGKAEFGERHPIVKKWCSAPLKIADQGDILLSVRAPVGPTNICNVKSCIGRGLAAIRCKKNKADHLFIWFYLRSIEKRIASKGVGSTFTAIGREEISKIQVPSVNYSVQRKIASILEKAESAREKRKQANHLTDEFLKSAFLEMFGDPFRNPKGWDKFKVTSLGKVQTGNTPSRKNSDNYGNYIEWIKSDNIINDEMFVSKSREMLSKEGFKKARFVESGSILVTCIAGSSTSIGNVALTNRKVSFNQQINAIKPYQDVNPIFLYGLFKMSKQLIQKSTTLGMKRIITKSKFENLVLIKPPLNLQQKFANLVQKVEKLKEKQSESENELNNLFNSLMQRAFRGKIS